MVFGWPFILIFASLKSGAVCVDMVNSSSIGKGHITKGDNIMQHTYYVEGAEVTCGCQVFCGEFHQRTIMDSFRVELCVIYGNRYFFLIIEGIDIEYPRVVRTPP
jgi:hypothetical protein